MQLPAVSYAKHDSNLCHCYGSALSLLPLWLCFGKLRKALGLKPEWPPESRWPTSENSSKLLGWETTKELQGLLAWVRISASMIAWATSSSTLECKTWASGPKVLKRVGSKPQTPKLFFLFEIKPFEKNLMRHFSAILKLQYKDQIIKIFYAFATKWAAVTYCFSSWD